MIESNPEVSLESRERGRNVKIVVKFMRHGEKTPDDYLTEYGREVTKEKAHQSGAAEENFDAVKAIGSTAGRKGPGGQERALESADIYAHEVAGDKAFNTRKQDMLNYEALINKAFPTAELKRMYKDALPENFEKFSDAEKAVASKKANEIVLNAVMAAKSAEAELYRKEAAGALAYVIDHYAKVARRLKPNSKVLIPAGSHSGTLEFILQQDLVRRDVEGSETVGFKNVQEIGGPFDPSEAFNVEIVTDGEGNLQPLRVSFDNSDRPKSAEMFLEPEKFKELRDFYAKLHERQ